MGFLVEGACNKTLSKSVPQRSSEPRVHERDECGVTTHAHTHTRKRDARTPAHDGRRARTGLRLERETELRERGEDH